ncbi:MAG: glycine cleavage system aminomethyltransferase GcvT, partial [Magnetococcales bacterium]|nr:glycine cleavage system aminomethyltransferase GcvT [Magnetococcales bacterium]
MHKTILHDRHIGLRANMAPFAGWEMPLHYGSQLREHLTVRNGCGIFDVSHMGVVDLTGGDVIGLLQWLLSCDIAPLVDGGGRYGLLLNEQGGITDDLIVYRVNAKRFVLVINAGNREKDVAWIRIHALAHQVTVTERTDLAILAVQGPKSVSHLTSVLPPAMAKPMEALPSFHILEQDGWRIARSGYTGEDGFELMVPLQQAGSLWDRLLHDGVMPSGLGARDTLRLEAGMSLYGRDIHDKSNPLECGLGWTLSWEPVKRNFIGRHALEP